MSEDEDLAALRARRDMDRLTLLDRVSEARELANPGTLAARARVDVEDKARSVAMQALEIANDHRGIVVATTSALVLWAMRAQMGRKLVQKMGPVAASVGRGIVEKAAPAVLAPLASPLIASLTAPVIGALLGRLGRGKAKD
jgi:hypothetical protein